MVLLIHLWQDAMQVRCPSQLGGGELASVEVLLNVQVDALLFIVGLQWANLSKGVSQFFLWRGEFLSLVKVVEGKGSDIGATEGLLCGRS